MSVPASAAAYLPEAPPLDGHIPDHRVHPTGDVERLALGENDCPTIVAILKCFQNLRCVVLPAAQRAQRAYLPRAGRRPGYGERKRACGNELQGKLGDQKKLSYGGRHHFEYRLQWIVPATFGRLLIATDIIGT